MEDSISTVPFKRAVVWPRRVWHGSWSAGRAFELRCRYCQNQRAWRLSSALALQFLVWQAVCSSLLRLPLSQPLVWTCTHLRYRAIVTVKKMTVLLVCIWVCAVVITLLNASYGKKSSSTLVWYCGVARAGDYTTAYIRVFKIVRHHQAQIHAHTTAQQQSNQGNNHQQQTSIAQQRKSLVSKFLIYCFVVVCFLPLAIAKVALSFTDGSVAVGSMFAISFAAVWLNSALNPLVYCWRFDRIRTAVIQTAFGDIPETKLLSVTTDQAAASVCQKSK